MITSRANFLAILLFTVTFSLSSSSISLAEEGVGKFPTVAAAIEEITTRLNPEKSAGVEAIMGFKLSDLEEGYGIHVHDGQADFIDHFPENPDVYITLDQATMDDILEGKLALSDAILNAQGAVKLTGRVTEMMHFVQMFDQAPDSKVKRLPSSITDQI